MVRDVACAVIVGGGVQTSSCVVLVVLRYDAVMNVVVPDRHVRRRHRQRGAANAGGHVRWPDWLLLRVDAQRHCYAEPRGQAEGERAGGGAPDDDWCRVWDVSDSIGGRRPGSLHGVQRVRVAVPSVAMFSGNPRAMNDRACARSTVSSGQRTAATQPLEMPRRLASLIHAESGWFGHGASPKSHWHAGGALASLLFLARRQRSTVTTWVRHRRVRRERCAGGDPLGLELRYPRAVAKRAKSVGVRIGAGTAAACSRRRAPPSAATAPPARA